VVPTAAGVTAIPALEIATAPDQLPSLLDAVHAVASEVAHESVAGEPMVKEVGFAVRVTVGGNAPQSEDDTA